MKLTNMTGLYILRDLPDSDCVYKQASYITNYYEILQAKLLGVFQAKHGHGHDDEFRILINTLVVYSRRTVILY